MSEYKETITKTSDENVDESGNLVQQETRQIKSDSSVSARSMVVNTVWFIVGTISVLLGLRFILKLLGANPNSGFVEFLYGITNGLTLPFDNIFGVTRTVANDVVSVFEPSIIIAAVVYLLVGWGLIKLFEINSNS